MRFKKWLFLSLGMVALLGLAACGTTSNKSSNSASNSTTSGSLKNVKYTHAVSYYRGGTAYTGTVKSLKLNTKKYTTKTITVNKKKIKVRCYTNVSYVSKPVDSKYQTMNIYIPESYFHNKKVNGYTKNTAPYFMTNTVGGYMSGAAGGLTSSGNGGGMKKPSGSKTMKLPAKPTGKKSGKGNGLNANGGASSTESTQKALSEGYIVAAAGARGRDDKKNSKNVGKAPASIVDLKAAVRYLKYNASRLPGNTNRIVADGTSAGGALSTLLGTTGNAKDYAPYLKAIGAADTSDDIYTAVTFAPITNLDHADSAYEWEFGGITKLSSSGMPGGPTTASSLTTKQQAASKELKKQFVTYLNGLNLKDDNGNKLTINSDGTGTLATLLKKKVMESAQTALDNGTTIKASKYPWLTIKSGKVTDVNLKKYFKAIGRSKTAPAFDSFDLSAGENNEFGTSTVASKHFTSYSQSNSTKKTTSQADSTIVKMMNPMEYIGTSQATVAKHFWIRYGEKDSNTSLLVPTLLAQKLKGAGVDVNYKVQWNTGHAGDYDLNALFKWLNKNMK